MVTVCVSSVVMSGSSGPRHGRGSFLVIFLDECQFKASLSVGVAVGIAASPWFKNCSCVDPCAVGFMIFHVLLTVLETFYSNASGEFWFLSICVGPECLVHPFGVGTLCYLW